MSFDELAGLVEEGHQEGHVSRYYYRVMRDDGAFIPPRRGVV